MHLRTDCTAKAPRADPPPLASGPAPRDGSQSRAEVAFGFLAAGVGQAMQQLEAILPLVAPQQRDVLRRVVADLALAQRNAEAYVKEGACLFCRGTIAPGTLHAPTMHGCSITTREAVRT